MKPSCFDPCLFIKAHGKQFGVTGMQVDDTLFTGTENFVKLEDTKIIESEFKAKNVSRLTENESLKFNGLIISLKNGTPLVQPNGQSNKINLVDPKDSGHFINYKRM